MFRMNRAVPCERLDLAAQPHAEPDSIGRIANPDFFFKTGREIRVLHSFYRMRDGSCLAFFEVPDSPFDFKDQHDFDLHIALQVDRDTLHSMFDRGNAEGRSPRGIADHGFIHSIYFRDPNGYVIELTSPTPDADAILAEAEHEAHSVLDTWQRTKPAG